MNKLEILYEALGLLKDVPEDTPFDQLSKSQQRIIKWCWDRRKDKYQAFDIAAMAMASMFKKSKYK